MVEDLDGFDRGYMEGWTDGREELLNMIGKRLFEAGYDGDMVEDFLSGV